MDIKVIPSALSGEVSIPPSKSAAHRALICAALSDGSSRITPYCTSKDTVVNSLPAFKALAEEYLG